METQIIACKDCKHFNREDIFSLSQPNCRHPNNFDIVFVPEYITGSRLKITSIKKLYAEDCRTSTDSCGHDAKWFEPRPTCKDSFKSWLKSIFKWRK